MPRPLPPNRPLGEIHVPHAAGGYSTQTTAPGKGAEVGTLHVQVREIVEAVWQQKPSGMVASLLGVATLAVICAAILVCRSVDLLRGTLQQGKYAAVPVTSV